MNKQTTPSKKTREIAKNKKAFHDYYIETRFEAGLALEGWEVKSLRAGRVQLKESYIILKKNEAWLFGAHFSPLTETCTHYSADPLRTRKLLLNRREINKLFAAKDRQGLAIVPIDLHWKNNKVKVEIAIAKGKKQHDKRQASKDKDWNRQQHRLNKRSI